MHATSLKEIAFSLNLITDSSVPILGVAVDSRLVKSGDLFFALPGAQSDGHAHLAEVAAKGAVSAVVHTSYAGEDFGLPLLRCGDVLQALQELTKAYLQKSKAQIVAVTGSLGKTTTKDFIGHLLKSKYKVSVSPGNSNSQIGLPLAILNHTHPDDEIIVLEMGMTHPGQITKLMQIAIPTVAVVTTVALQHACNFDSIEEIAQAKAEIFAHPDTKVGFYHLESDYGAKLSTTGTCPKISFSTTSETADLFLQGDATKTEFVYSQAAGSEFGLKSHITLAPLTLLGAHNRHNLLAALAVAHYFGISPEQMSASISTMALPERRLERVEKFGATFINDAYNASELSMKAALSCLPTPKPGAKRIAVLAEILELGKFSQQCHQAVGEYALNYVDMMFCYGEGCKPIRECWKAAGKPVVWAPERAEIVAALRSQLQPGDVVLLKGSRSKGVWKVLDEL